LIEVTTGIKEKTLVESLLCQKLMVIVNRFIQIVKMSLQISKLKKEVLALRPHFEAGVTQLVEFLPSKHESKMALF